MFHPRSSKTTTITNAKLTMYSQKASKTLSGKPGGFTQGLSLLRLAKGRHFPYRDSLVGSDRRAHSRFDSDVFQA